MPIDDNNNLIAQDRQNTDTISAMDELTPPQYGEHQFDRLYSDIDPTGYMTPVGGPSGFNTPFTSRSRSVSTENLASLDTVASNDLAANVLQTRLNNLEVVGQNRIGNENANTIISRQISNPREDTSEQPEANGHCDSDNSADICRRVSDDDAETSGHVTPQHIEYSAESLAKVPSYTTALQSQTRRPINDGLPSYHSATQRHFRNTATLYPPGQSPIHRSMDNHRDFLRRCS